MHLLKPSNYFQIKHIIDIIPINTLFARSVIEHKVNGKIYVNCLDNPHSAYIVHSYGMSLLCGDWTNDEFNQAIAQYALNPQQDGRTEVEWLQAYPQEWHSFLDELVDKANQLPVATIEQHTRINFRFNTELYLKQKPHLQADTNIQIIRTTEDTLTSMKGSVIPAYFWKSVQDFLDNAIGFSVLYEGKHASTAFSSFIHTPQLEIGIETTPEFHGRGMAYIACSALIDYCLQNNLEPVWACRGSNHGSYHLAYKLGFGKTQERPFYKLCI